MGLRAPGWVEPQYWSPKPLPGASRQKACGGELLWSAATGQVELAGDGKGRYEVSVPLSLLDLRPKPGLRMKGDIGILRGNGTETTARSHWSNKATGIAADVPSEAALTPHLWGYIEWE